MGLTVLHGVAPNLTGDTTMSQAQPAVRPRRSRALQTEARATVVQPGANVQDAPGATPAMVAIAQKVVALNATKNLASSEEKKAVLALNKLMIGADLKQFPFTVEVKGAFQACEAIIEETKGEYIDVTVLRSLVDDATFMKIVAAAKGKTVELAGENVALKATRPETKPASLKIRKVTE
jgi:hypothetical protein